MQSLSDAELLQEYANHASEESFRKIVTRYTDLVYSAALRQVQSPDLAKDVTQTVFIDLAHKASSLSKRSDAAALIGWLYQSTRYRCLTLLRTERRRQTRETHAMEQLTDSSESPQWEHIGPVLDQAMTELSDDDRNALLLRFFHNEDFHSVGMSLGISSDAAQKRVTRAVEKLRRHLSQMGITAGAAGLTFALTANAVQAAPVGLAAGITSAASVSASTAINATAATKTIIMTATQKAAAMAIAAILVGAVVYEAVKVGQLNRENAQLRQQQSSLSAEMTKLRTERDEAARQLALAQNQIARLQRDTANLQKLRAEVTKLRENVQSTSQTETSAKEWMSRIALLKQKLEKMPDKKIPELAFVTDKDWNDAAWDADLNSEAGVREALSKLRESAINVFLNEMMKDAFKKYLAEHDGILPTTLLELKPYFDKPVTDDMLSHYKLLQNGKPDNAADLVVLKSYADEDYDSNHGMSINGAWGGRFNRIRESVEASVSAYAQDHKEQAPKRANELRAYVDPRISDADIEKYFSAAVTRYSAQPITPELRSAFTVIDPVIKAFEAANPGKAGFQPADLRPYAKTPEQQTALDTFEKEASKFKNPTP